MYWKLLYTVISGRAFILFLCSLLVLEMVGYSMPNQILQATGFADYCIINAHLLIFDETVFFGLKLRHINYLYKIILVIKGCAFAGFNILLIDVKECHNIDQPVE